MGHPQTKWEWDKPNVQHNPYLVKVSMKRAGGQLSQKSVHVVYEWPFLEIFVNLFTNINGAWGYFLLIISKKLIQTSLV